MGERGLSQEEPVVGGAEPGGRPPLPGGGSFFSVQSMGWVSSRAFRN